MAENRVTIEGNYSTPLPVVLTGTMPPGSAIQVAAGPPSAASAPLSTSVLTGSVLADDTIITIPAGKIWYGWLSLNASLSGASQVATASIATIGTGAVPDPTTNILSLTLALGTTNTGVNADKRTQYIYVYAPVGNSVDLRVFLDGGLNVNATAYGFLLA